MQRIRQEILEKVKAYCEAASACDGNKERINYAGRVYDYREMCNVVDSALDFWLTAGKYNDDFERGLSEYLDVRFCSTVNSGSSANLLAVMALMSPLLGERRIKRGDEIITVAAGFPTTIAPIIQAGVVPVFIDICIPSYNADVSVLSQALSDKTKAVVLAHSLGNPFHIKAVKEFCHANNLWLVEDNCDSLGSEYALNGSTQKTGTFGHIGTSSFYPPHHITMGEGGAVYTNDPLISKIVLSLRDWGRDCTCPGGRDNKCGKRFEGTYGSLPKGYDHKYVYSHFGYNLKITDMQAAIGCAQLEKLPRFVEARRENWRYLRQRLECLAHKLVLPEAEPNSNPSWFGFMMSVKEDAGCTRNEITSFLEKHNIQTRNLFSGNILRHPCFETLKEGEDYRVCGMLTNTDFVMNNGFWIGVYPGMTKEKLDRMVAILSEGMRD